MVSRKGGLVKGFDYQVLSDEAKKLVRMYQTKNTWSFLGEWKQVMHTTRCPQLYY